MKWRGHKLKLWYKRARPTISNKEFSVYYCEKCFDLVLVPAFGSNKHVIASHHERKCGDRISFTAIFNSIVKNQCAKDGQDAILTNIKAGIASGFPLCCVMYQTFIHRHVIDSFIHTMHDDFFSPGYVKCPLCLYRQKYNKVIVDPDRVEDSCVNVSWKEAFRRWLFVSEKFIKPETYNLEDLFNSNNSEIRLV